MEMGSLLEIQALAEIAFANLFKISEMHSALRTSMRSSAAIH